jgi:hypothetical protein
VHDDGHELADFQRESRERLGIADRPIRDTSATRWSSTRSRCSQGVEELAHVSGLGLDDVPFCCQTALGHQPSAVLRPRNRRRGAPPIRVARLGPELLHTLLGS